MIIMIYFLLYKFIISNANYDYYHKTGARGSAEIGGQDNTSGMGPIYFTHFWSILFDQLI